MSVQYVNIVIFLVLPNMALESINPCNAKIP